MMIRRLGNSFFLVAVLCFLISPANGDLIGHWTLDEESGAVAYDSSPSGWDGIVSAGAENNWIPGGGKLGGTLDFTGQDYVIVPDFEPTDGIITVGVWAYARSRPGWSNLVTNWAGVTGQLHFGQNPSGLLTLHYTQSSGASVNTSDSEAFPLEEWQHCAFVGDGTNLILYRNGNELTRIAYDGTAKQTLPLLGIGCKPNGDLSSPAPDGATPAYWDGFIDDVTLFDHALTQDEVNKLMEGVGEKELASDPVPEDAAVDVLRDTMLSWEAGEFAGTHDVYFGTAFNDVNDAGTGSDLLVSQGQNANSFELDRMEFGQTYFWRVDEVNGAPDRTIFKGDVWSFEAEPYSIQIPGDTVAVTASSSSNEFSQPEQAIDGSGLGADGSHAITPETMWFTASVDLDPWIQFELDAVRKLDSMRVWNSNSSAEIAIGWGVKDVIIEYSKDGDNWDVLADATQFSRAPGLPTYNQFDTIDFGGVAAKYVRLNIQSNWGGILMSYGLSEVQFSMIPAEARTPDPESGAVDVQPDSLTAWRAGREAAQHTVYVSTDMNAVADGTASSVTSSTNSLDLTSLDLELGQTYAWRVDEVNDTEVPSVWAGPVWRFSTLNALIVDDFESFNNKSPNRPFQTWLDGFGYSADEFLPADFGGNGTGSGIGHDIWSLSSPYYNGDIMETTNTLPGSGRSLPFYYTNTGGVASQTDRTFAEPQDWTIGGAKTLSIAFFGQPDNTGTLYIKINGTKVTYPHDPANIARDEWQAWNIDLSSMAVQAVTTLQIGVEGASASGMILIDDIKLYPMAGERLTPAAPSSDALVGAWSFDEGSGTVAADSSGNGHNGTITNGAWEAGPAGSALVFDGLTSQADLPAAAWNTIDQQVTVSLWAYVDSTVTQSPVTFAAYQDPTVNNARVISTHLVWSDGNLYFDAGGEAGGYDRISQAAPASVYADAWVHWAFTKNVETGEQKVYRNGMLWLSGSGLVRPMTGVTTFTLGAHNGANFWQGSMDEFQLYNKELAEEEILWLAGVTAPIDKPF
jgi:hypothetical protein